MEGVYAVCAGGRGEERLDTLLTGPLEPGQWVLGFHGAARAMIDAERAAQVAAALAALAKVGAGDTAADGLDDLLREGFADLIDREPQLPDFLRNPSMP